jgi:sugar/nucleoside kinase (ribokinase family)
MPEIGQTSEDSPQDEEPKLVVSGTMGFEEVDYPTGRLDRTVGGSGLYAAIAAAYHAPTVLVAAVGSDIRVAGLRGVLPKQLRTNHVLETVGESFSWRARYADFCATPQTLATSLGPLSKRRVLPNMRGCGTLLCTNEDPAFQLRLLGSIKPQALIYGVNGVWMSLRRQDVLCIGAQAKVLLISGDEWRHWPTDQREPKDDRIVVVSRAADGVEVVSGRHHMVLRAPPGMDNIVDVTGAGDVLAGGVSGFLSCLNRPIDFNEVVRAVTANESIIALKLKSHGARDFAARVCDASANLG